MALAFVAIASIWLALAGKVTQGRPDPPKEMEHALYVWQRQWTAGVSEAVGKSAPRADNFMVLGTEFDVENGRLRAHRASADWSAFAAVQRPVWVVLRARSLPGIDQEAGRRTLSATLAEEAGLIMARMPETQVLGVQIDYDCATENLGLFAAFLDVLREDLGDVPLSITALPTWLGQSELDEVVEGLDHFVLQVHSFERLSADQAVLCDTERIPHWLDAAEALKCPFYVALPTYGYRMVIDERGELTGLQAEEPARSYVGQTTREIMADPAAMAGVVRMLNAKRPQQMQGIVWFRLPVEGDRLNWTWPALAGVMDGKAPAANLLAEVRKPDPLLYEIWVVNRGNYRPTEPIRIPVDWTRGDLLAHDTVNGFTYHEDAPGKTVVTGKAPEPGEEKMAGWFRFAEGKKGQEIAFCVGAVEVTE